jgi:hypothetical protein
MAFLGHINRYDDLNFNEDFEESIAKTTDSFDEDEEGLLDFQRVHHCFLEVFFNWPFRCSNFVFFHYAGSISRTGSAIFLLFLMHVTIF